MKSFNAQGTENVANPRADVTTNFFCGDAPRRMSAHHVKHVAAFVADVFGGPKTYSEKLGGHANMLLRHVGRGLT